MESSTIAAPPAPAPAQVSTGNTANSGSTVNPGKSASSGGMFDKIKYDTNGLTDQPSAEGQPDATAAKPGEGQPPLTAAEIKAAGRTFKDANELSKAYEESSQEGIRLYRERESLVAEIKKREQAIEDFKAQLDEARKTPAFKELSKEELKNLYAEDPIQATEYMTQLAEFKANQKRAKAEQEASKASKEAERKEVLDHVNARVDDMINDPKTYPDFKELQPVMNEIMDITNGAVSGKKWSADLVYLSALGLKALRSHQAGLSKTKEAEEQAKAEAAAKAAQGGGSPAGDGGTGGPDAGDDSDEAFNARLEKAAPSKLF